MTSKASRARGGSAEMNDDIELWDGLWQEAPFPQLPRDAPAELHDYVREIENPSRVYAVHRARRRHDFQALVDRYIFQLREGCGQRDCTTPTCFTCRKRVAGRAPIRRYNATSARTLAVYLAGQDNPQDGLCPVFRPSRNAPVSLGTLVFSKRPSSPADQDNKKGPKRTSVIYKDGSASNRKTGQSSPHQKPTQPSQDLANPRVAKNTDESGLAQPEDEDDMNHGKFVVKEKAINKDHRSFAANLFGTVAFRMLEWLTPQGVDAISKKVSALDNDKPQKSDDSDCDGGTTKNIAAQTSTSPSELADTISKTSASSQGTGHMREDRGEDPALSETVSADSMCFQNESKPLQNLKTLPRATAVSKPRKTIPLTASPPPSSTLDEAKATVVSPRLNGFHHDVKPKTPKTTSHTTTHGIPEAPAKPAFFENVHTPVSPTSRPTVVHMPSRSNGKSALTASTTYRACDPTPPASNDGSTAHDQISEVPDSWLQDALPQSLSELNVELIEFICDVFQEDDTAEDQQLFPRDNQVSLPSSRQQAKRLSRQSRPRSASLKRQWKAFNEQSIFSTLSDPHALIQSFAHNDNLYDSHSLWYCLYRLARVAPSLVYHSLWIAAGNLFILPESVQSQLPGKPKVPPRDRSKLSPEKLSRLMSICLHALVAAAPIVPTSQTLFELSRLRSHGLIATGGNAIARQPPSRCLDYHDGFSNDLVIRLARRLFCSIAVRQCVNEMTTVQDGLPKATSEMNILQSLLDQLDFLSTRPSPILHFEQPERLLHESRVPAVLLDWARTVLLMEWNGRADFSVDTPFGGALFFIETMYRNRNLLLLGDIQFRVDFLCDRLDSMEMPVNWLSFKSTGRVRHLLDYPYIFGADTLVSFFRSINFARMSRMFEESSSLKTRMSAIVDPGSLITNPHHKMVLQDLLKTASSKYLILIIKRNTVAKDAFDQLWRRERRELLRPLKVHLGEEGGELGFDSGGVQQEFFRLAIAECLDPTYGAFTVDERTRMTWFSPGSLTEEWKFELVGLLVSLALYNGLTLPITFPKALYRKLLGKPMTELHHIADGWPDLASGLTALLEWNEQDGRVEDVFARTYEFAVSALGSHVTREMQPDGTTWPTSIAVGEDLAPPHVSNPEDAPLVTNENRDAYVSDYIRYLTDVSVEPQFRAFQRGFHACIDKKSLTLLSPQVLQSLVEGVQEIDISELRRYTRYVGWDSSHHTVKDFWSIVKRYDDRMKRRLLEFVTSSDRIPVGGMRNLQFVIQKNGEEDEAGHLPTAYTCYGTLLLPEYRNKEVLRERLAMALENSQGFGFA